MTTTTICWSPSCNVWHRDWL